MSTKKTGALGARILLVALLTVATLLSSCQASSPPGPAEPVASSSTAKAVTNEAMTNENSASPALPESIGAATMTPDGTIVLQLRATDSAGVLQGDGLLRYPLSHPDYQKVLKHLGGLAPGDEKPVPPFPEKW